MHTIASDHLGVTAKREVRRESHVRQESYTRHVEEQI